MIPSLLNLSCVLFVSLHEPILQQLSASSFQLLKTAELFFPHSARLSHEVIGDCTAAWIGRMLGTEVGINSSFVALIATELVSIAIPWLLLPLEVGVNRHGQKKQY